MRNWGRFVVGRRRTAPPVRAVVRGTAWGFGPRRSASAYTHRSLDGRRLNRDARGRATVHEQKPFTRGTDVSSNWTKLFAGVLPFFARIVQLHNSRNNFIYSTVDNTSVVLCTHAYTYAKRRAYRQLGVNSLYLILYRRHATARKD
jgi:hypothetical protein